MRRLAVLLLLAFLLLAAGASASSYSLGGTYKATIRGKPAPLDGKWRLEFLPNSVVHTIRNGKLVVVGKAARIGAKRLLLSDQSGSYACDFSEGKGTYVYALSRGRLTFKVVKDKCVGRKLVLTTKPFVR
ncbi:MAG: hypothetical protein ACJ75G_05300 [Gaiellaceae bacterium]